jgi:hypothetical protein
MFRPSRPTLHWLLWLVIALLPLRGWAMAQMAPMAVAPVSMAQAAVVDALPPCHTGVPDTEATPTHAGCSLCEVCHASLGLPAVSELHLPALPHAAPTATPITGVRDGPPGELFRPPRHSA